MLVELRAWGTSDESIVMIFDTTARRFDERDIICIFVFKYRNVSKQCDTRPECPAQCATFAPSHVPNRSALAERAFGRCG
jgi:hypothetical protein